MYEKELDAAQRAARAAGAVLMSKFNDTHKITMKTPRDLVTEADVAAEKAILEILKKEFPDYSILSEEAGAEKRKSQFTWVIDPLDGTTNYSMKNPFFNVAIALTHKNEPIVAAVYFPPNDELFSAVKGKGAFINGKKIHVSDKSDFKASLGGFCYGTSNEAAATMARIYNKIMPVTRGFTQMRSGELELAYVACGRLDFFLNAQLLAWDVAAGALLVREAGGTVTDFTGAAWGLTKNNILVSNGIVHKELVKLLK